MDAAAQIYTRAGRRPDSGAGHDELIVKTVSVRRLPSLLLQTMDDELGTIARQDFLFGGLPLATVDSLFFLCPLCCHLLILGSDCCRARRLGAPLRAA